MTVKETYHADCLRIKQLERDNQRLARDHNNIYDKWQVAKQQLAQYKELYYMVHDYIKVGSVTNHDLARFLNKFEREQNGNDK